MLRLFLAMLVISLMVEVVPASAEDCMQWCRTNRCSGMYNGPTCMNRCVAACQQKTSKQHK
jgi:hypothetical protein